MPPLPTQAALIVEGLPELSAAFSKAGRQTTAAFRRELVTVAEPIRRDASALARQQITRIGPVWSQMRTGATRKLVYVAPKQRSAKRRSRTSKSRPNLANLLAARAMGPALERNRARIRQETEEMLERVARDFNLGT